MRATTVAARDLRATMRAPRPARAGALACAVQPHRLMMLERADNEIVGRIAYVDPSKEWGYLHGPRGQRVYFHAVAVQGAIADLALGAAVHYDLAPGGDPPCAISVVACARGAR